MGITTDFPDIILETNGYDFAMEHQIFGKGEISTKISWLLNHTNILQIHFATCLEEIRG